MNSKAIIFIANDLQYEVAKESVTGFERVAVATDDPDVRYLCERDRIICHDLWAHTDDYEMGEIEQQVISALEEFSSVFHGAVVLDGCDIVDAVKYDMQFVFRRIAFGSYAVGRLLDESQPDRVIHFGEMERTTIWESPICPPDVFNAVAAYCAEQRNIATETLHYNGPELTVHFPLKKKAAHVHCNRRTRTVPSRVQAISTADEHTNEHQYFWNYLGRSNNKDWVVIGDKMPEGNVPFISLRWLRRLPFKLPDCSVISQRVQASRPSSLFKSDGLVNSAIFSVAVFDFVWKELERWVEAASLVYLQGKLICSAYRQKVSVINWDLFGRNRALVHALEAGGSHSLSVIHAGPSFYLP